MPKPLQNFLVCAAVAVLVGAGCGGGLGENAASKLVKTPELPTDKQAKCKVAKSQTEPLVVEWPDTARGKLESLARHGLVAVHYVGCELQVLGRCHVKSGAYAYSPVTRKESRVTIRDEDELYANLPVGAVRLEGKLKSAGQVNVQMTIGERRLGGDGREEELATRSTRWARRSAGRARCVRTRCSRKVPEAATPRKPRPIG